MDTTPGMTPWKRQDGGTAGNPQDRLEHDRDLLERLLAAEFKGPLFDHLYEELWRYGWNCLRSWMKDGTIAERCAAHRLKVTCLDREIDELRRNAHQREDLPAPAVQKAVEYFMETSLPRGYWKPDKGASMRTYLIHDCLYRFRSAFNAWARPHRRYLEATGDLLFGIDWGNADFEERLALRDALHRILERAPAEARAIAALLYTEPYTQREIGEKLRLSVRSVEGYMRRLRMLAKDMQYRGEIDIPFGIAFARTAGAGANGR